MTVGHITAGASSIFQSGLPRCSTSSATGTARVKVDYLGRASLAGSDDRQLLASLRRDGAPASMDAATCRLPPLKPAFTPTPRPRRNVERIAMASTELPGFERSEPVQVALEPPAPAPSRPAAAERVVALAPSSGGEPAAAFAEAPATAAGQPLAAAVTPGLTRAVPRRRLSSFPRRRSARFNYSTPSSTVAQPAAAWRIRNDGAGTVPRLYAGGDYTLQAGLFRNLSNAERLARKLDGDAPATVTAKRIKGELVYSVTIGPITSRDAADALLQRAIGAGAADATLRRS